MHNRFRRACYALAGGVAVTAALGLTAAGAANASPSLHPKATPDATKTCGNKCNDLFNVDFGPKFIANTNGHYGNRVDLAIGHNFTPSEDFIASEVGTLADFCTIDGGSGLIPNNAYACITYPKTFPVFEEEYAPYSVTSGYCAAVRAHDVKIGARISLRDCGFSARSLWVADLNNSVPDKHSVLGIDFPWVNGADASFSHALDLTTDDSGNLTLQELSSNGGAVNDNQLWGIRLGPVK